MIEPKRYMVRVHLVYVPAAKQAIQLTLTLQVGSTVAAALEHSGLLQSHPEIKDRPVGIFGTVVPLNTLLKTGDRIEIYRPLLIDPKEKRRQRARGV